MEKMKTIYYWDIGHWVERKVDAENIDRYEIFTTTHKTVELPEGADIQQAVNNLIMTDGNSQTELEPKSQTIA